MSNITVKNWYQLDFKITDNARPVIFKLSELIVKLKTKKLIKKWFYLFEGTTIRIRFKSEKESELKQAIDELATELALVMDPEKPFEPYSEDSDKFSNIEVVETFANMMSELSSLTIQRLKTPGDFSNFNLAERLCHCIFNNIYGSNTEEYFRLKLFGVNFPDDNPEQTVVDEIQNYARLQNGKMDLPSILIPMKGKKE